MSRADQFAALAPEVEARWRKFASGDRVVYPKLLGMVVDDVRVDYCRMTLPYRPELEQGAGLVHGGAIASLLDAVLVPAVGSAYGREARYSTVDMHVQFIGAVVQQDIIAEGWIVRRGRTTVFCESEAVNAVTGKLIARAVLTYNVSGNVAT
jgi:uncharacterized protein (TIGR00369 family)